MMTMMWRCKACGYDNLGKYHNCRVCKAKKPLPRPGQLGNNRSLYQDVPRSKHGLWRRIQSIVYKKPYNER